jgi:hypothetical protein
MIAPFARNPSRLLMVPIFRADGNGLGISGPDEAWLRGHFKVRDYSFGDHWLLPNNIFEYLTKI